MNMMYTFIKDMILRADIYKNARHMQIYYMHKQEIPWFLPDIKLVFSLFSKKKYFLLAGEINLFNRNYFFFVTYEQHRFWPCCQYHLG